MFVEEFILDRTLTPAIQTFGYKVVRMMDPTCGSGHFCLGAFDRLFRLWQQENPGENPRVLAQRALDGVYGVDLNPYAVAICLENGGLGRFDLLDQLRRLPPGLEMSEPTIASILDHMCSNRLLASDGVRYFVGEEGENKFGRRNFIELVSVFTSAPVLAVTDGRQDLGMVDQNLFFSSAPSEGRLLSLAGRGWRVERVDWKERRVHVVATDLIGKTTWFGASAGLSLKMAVAIQEILQTDEVFAHWSQRAATKLLEVRHKFSFLKPNHTTVTQSAGENICWYTFAGEPINQALADALEKRGLKSEKTDDYAIYFSAGPRREDLDNALRCLTAVSVVESMGSNMEAERALKFQECLPSSLSTAEVVARRCKESDLTKVLSEPRHHVVMNQTNDNDAV